MCKKEIKIKNKWPKPTIRKPSIKQLNKYTLDSICPATDGCQVEPDGVCEHGYPSWLLYLGYI